MTSLGAFDHLILLIGTNPLPNYVTARYLFEQRKREGQPAPTLHLVHTQETKDIAERIALQLDKDFGDWFNKENPQHCDYIWLDDAYDTVEIIKGIKKKEFGKLNGIVHLNHTGATKAIAVETVVLAREEIDPSRLICTTLSPVSYRLHSDKGGVLLGDDLRDKVKLTLPKLFDLHHCEYEDDESFVWCKTAEALLQFAQLKGTNDKKSISKLNGWANDNFKNQLDNIAPEKRKAKAAEFLITRQKPLCTFPEDAKIDAKKTNPEIERDAMRKAFAPVREAWQQEAPHIVEIIPSEWNLSQEEKIEEILRFQRFLSSGWMEYLVADRMNATGEWNEIKHGCHIKPKRTNATNMEIDVLALKGYSLTLVSCTTEDETKDVKLKAFEALHRAQQLGGDEARAVVLSMIDYNLACDLSNVLETDHGGRPPLILISKRGLNNLEKTLQSIARREKDRDTQKEIVVY